MNGREERELLSRHHSFAAQHATRRGFPVLLREVASQLLYTIKRRTFVTRALHQQETKAAAFVVCEALELDSRAAFSDCQLYYGDSRLLAESLETVHRTAAAILGAISPEIAAPGYLKQGVN